MYIDKDGEQEGECDRKSNVEFLLITHENCQCTPHSTAGWMAGWCVQMRSECGVRDEMVF